MTINFFFHNFITPTEGPMFEDAQMRLKTGTTKGEVTKSDGSKPKPSEEDVKSHPRYI
jgi:hypothetical protein